MSCVQSVVNKIDQNLNEHENYFKAKVLGVFALPLAELLDGIFHSLSAVSKIPVAAIKLPISFFILIQDQPKWASVHVKMAGVKDVYLSASKAILCFFNIIWVPCLSLLSLKLTVIYHEECQLYVKTYKEKALVQNFSKKTFNDMTGMQSLKDNLQQVILSWNSKDELEGFDIQPTNGVLFYGPPGCGKTLAAECLAGEMNLPFYACKASDLTSKYVNGSVEKIDDLFKQIINQKGGVLFIDEIESLVTDRSSTKPGSSASIEDNKLISELLVQLQNASKNNILVLVATNHLSHIDPAIIRPGRFDIKIEIPLPDAESCAHLLKHYLSKNKYLDFIDEQKYMEWGQQLQGYSPSDIKQLVQLTIWKVINDIKKTGSLRNINSEDIQSIIDENKKSKFS